MLPILIELVSEDYKQYKSLITIWR